MKAAKAALEPLKLEPIAAGDDRLMLPGDRAKLEAFKPPKDPYYTLTSGIDSIVLLRTDLKGLLDPKDMDRQVFTEKEVKPLGTLPYLPSHAILDRGRVIGLWEYDTAADSVAWIAFVIKDKAMSRTRCHVRNNTCESNWATHAHSAWTARRAARPGSRRFAKLRANRRAVNLRIITPLVRQ